MHDQGDDSIRSYFSRVRASTRRHLSNWADSQSGDDIAQNVLLKALQQVELTESLPDEPLTMAMVREQVALHWRNRAAENKLNQRLAVNLAQAPVSASLSEIRDEVESIRSQITERRWEIFTADVLGNDTRTDVAQKMSIAASTVRQVKHLIRKQFRGYCE